MTGKKTEPECWCPYGTRGGGIEEFGREYTEPGCPAHDPHGAVEHPGAPDLGGYEEDPYDQDQDDDEGGEWRPGTGTCDRCMMLPGESVGPLGVCCACAIGQGAGPGDCVCGPRAEAEGASIA
jgi:hypothetical protein